MKLINIIDNMEIDYIKGDIYKSIHDIKYDSRQIDKGDLFICVQGFKTDGHRYIDDVIQKGAKAVVIDKELEEYSDNITYIKVNDSRVAMPLLAKNFFGDPLQDIDLIGVTGTNGKTTTTYLIKEILNKGGYKTGLIGTIEVFDGEKNITSSRTTPEAPDIYRFLAEMRENDVKYAVMEVSSHALALNRVDTMEFKTAVFTNLSQDHLDYHNTMEEYASQKAKLFKKIKKGGTAIINVDDDYCNLFIKQTENDVITYSINKNSDLKAEDIELSLKGVSFKIDNLRFDLNLTGKFNIYNCLSAIGVAKSLDINNSIIKNSLESVSGIPGRFETVDLNQPYTVIVDYAHTPDSMINILEAVKHFDHNDIIIVFGCGGERDKGKRPIMGDIAVRKGDSVVVTTDNPRAEDPETIISEIVKGIKDSKSDTPYIIVPDREEAIYEAVGQAQKGDLLIIFGKGHETYQEFADETIDFDDKEVAKRAIKEKKSEYKDV